MGRIEEFFARHPVFTLEEFRREVGNTITTSTLHTHLKRYRKTGRINSIKQGLYYVARAGQQTDTAPVDPYLVASKAEVDAILGFHTAFELLGAGHSQFSRIYYLTQTPKRAFTFRNTTFQAVQTPRALLRRNEHHFGSEQIERLGQPVTITGRERTLVDCLERPDYCGGWEEVYRCAEKLPYLQFDILLEYLNLRDQKILFAKTGFFLEQHREDFFVEERFLQELEKRTPRQPLYLDRSANNGRLLKRWNLVVPEAFLNRIWEEF